VNAFVEIVFDNSDHRFNVEQSDEVVLRRTVGLHKDEFFLQRRRATKQEIQSLLEGAGFSKSNPYFIVQQGKVQDLCTMSDAERLKLLQEVAGTVVYDEKKAESVRKMQENAASCTKIQEILTDMDSRLTELQSEKDELTAYTAADRQRRAVEYSLYDQEWHKARTVLDAVEQERALHVENVRELHETAKETHNRIRQHEAILKQVQNARKRNRSQLQALSADKTAALQLFTQLNSKCREMEELFSVQQGQYKANQKELVTVEKEILQAQTDLEQRVQPAFDEAVAALQNMMARRDGAARQMEALYAKQGRGRQFTTRVERDAFLQTSIAELLSAKAEKENEMTGLRDTLANLRRTVEQEIKDVTKLQQEVTEKSGHLLSISKTMDAKKSERLQLLDARKEEWRLQQELEEQVRDARAEYQRACSDTRKAMPRATAMGLEALKTIVEQEGLVQGEQYFGMLMDNMTLRDEKYQTAVEVAAQNSLFHVIVDNDQTASKLMMRLEQGKLGRVTFLPLNRLRVEKVQYPDNNDVRPMLDLCIQYDKKVERAMQHIFSKKLIARSPELASEWSAKLSMDAITLDGDLCGRKGALTGGYVDSAKSRLRAHNRQEGARAALQDAERDHKLSSVKAQHADQATTKLMQELQRLEAKHGELSHIVTAKETDLERLLPRLENRKKQVGNIETLGIPPLECSITLLDGDAARLREEMGTDLTKTLSDDDRHQLAELKQVQASVVEEIEAKSETVAQAGLERQKLQSLLDDNLLKRRRELSEGITNEDEEVSGRRKSRLSSTAAQAQRKEELEEYLRQFEIQTRVKEDIEERLDKAREEEEKYRNELIAVKNEFEQLKSQDIKNMKSLEDAQDKSDRLLNKVCCSKTGCVCRVFDLSPFCRLYLQ
jgi:structural maintenance of chromosome 3 (chondroitin sulfate proteoglycan 6)